MHVDPRIGQETIEANRRFYMAMLWCEFLVLLLGLISSKTLRWAFWVGWAINVIVATILTLIMVWLEFTWRG